MFNRLRIFAQTTTILGVAMIVLVWAGVVLLSNAERDHAYEASLRQGDNLTRIFEAYISQVFKGTDSALLALRNSYERTPRDFDLKLWVDNAKLQNDLVIQFSIIGRDGIMKSSTLASSGPPVDLSDRDHFRYHAHATTDELFISPPVLGRVSGKATVQLARKLRAPDGSFDGVILASLDIQQVENFYNSIDVGQSGMITLVGFDGIIRARSTRQDDPGRFIGRSMAGSKVFELYPTSPTGSYWTPPDTGSRMDGVPRLISYRVVEGLPLIAIVGLAKDDIFEQASLTTTQYRQVGFALTAFVLVVIGFGAIRQMRLASAMAALESSRRSLGQTNTRFNAALENMAHALCMFDGRAAPDRLQQAVWRDVRPDARANQARHNAAFDSRSSRRGGPESGRCRGVYRRPSGGSRQARDRIMSSTSCVTAGSSPSATSRCRTEAGLRFIRTSRNNTSPKSASMRSGRN